MLFNKNPSIVCGEQALADTKMCPCQVLMQFKMRLHKTGTIQDSHTCLNHANPALHQRKLCQRTSGSQVIQPHLAACNDSLVYSN